MNRLFCILFILVLGAPSCLASDLRLSKEVTIVKVEQGRVTLGIDVSWSNSWRDEYNNDAVWLFLKYRTLRTDWEHAILSDHYSVSDQYAAYPGKTGTEIVGYFVYRDTIGAGTSSVHLEIDWNYPSWLTPAMFTSGEVMLQAQGVEMVLVPFGSYALGDGVSDNGFLSVDNRPLTIQDERAQAFTYGVSGNSAVYLPSAYPKGYNGFYCMKYELSQGQYVSFLNSLSRKDQLKLLGERLKSLNKGTYLFGDGTSVSFRNAILIKEPLTDTRGAVFGCKNTVISGAYPLACNYLSPSDLLGYASWSGLRPMSELEYEKICRRSAPLIPVAGSYAWGSASYQSLSGLADAGTDRENPLAGNVNGGYGGTSPVAGPVRCGAFSTVGRDKESAGSSFSGVMELSGNVRETVVNINASGFGGTHHGNGTFDLYLWTDLNVPGVFGTRGGSFLSAASRLRVSDRSEITGVFPSLDDHFPDVGFRCVRMFDASTIQVNPGTISGDGVQKYCTGESFAISGVQEAFVPGLGGVEIEYQWYMDGGEITGARGATLDFPAGLSNAPVYADKTYRFTRKANCALGVATTAGVDVIVYGTMSLGVTPDLGSVTSDNASEFKAGVQHSGEVGWWESGDSPRLLSGPVSVSRGDTVSYIPSYFDFNYKTGRYTLICRASTPAGCKDSIILPLTINVDIQPGKLSAPEKICMGEQLAVTGTPAVLAGMPSGVKPVYSWYKDNILLAGETGEKLSLSTGLKGGLNYTFFRRSTVDDGTYRDSDTVQVHIERCLPLKPDGTPYATVMVDTCEWLAENLMDTEKCGRSWDNGSYGRLYDWEAAGCSCPAGWRLPDSQDWVVWEREYGQSGLGRMMKSATDDWTLGGKGTNNSGFSGLPGGYMRAAASSVNDQGIKGYWWSLTREGTNPAYYELSNQSSDLTAKTLTRTNGLSVRCVRNE